MPTFDCFFATPLQRVAYSAFVRIQTQIVLWCFVSAKHLTIDHVCSVLFLSRLAASASSFQLALLLKTPVDALKSQMKPIKCSLSRFKVANFLRRLLSEVVISDFVDDLFWEILFETPVTRDRLLSNVLCARQKSNVTLLCHLSCLDK